MENVNSEKNFGKTRKPPSLCLRANNVSVGALLENLGAKEMNNTQFLRFIPGSISHQKLNIRL